MGKGAVVGGGLYGSFGAGGLGGVWGLLLGGEAGVRGAIGASLSVLPGVFRRWAANVHPRPDEGHLLRSAFG